MAILYFPSKMLGICGFTGLVMVENKEVHKYNTIDGVQVLAHLRS